MQLHGLKLIRVLSRAKRMQFLPSPSHFPLHSFRLFANNARMKSFFVFDVESVGLHGEGFAVGGGVYLENGSAQSEFRYACPISEARGTESDREWVKANIPVLEVTHHLPSRVREMFWMEWLKAKAQYPEIVMAAECGWPVEARFLCACVDDSRESRNWTGPYPLLEISSVMMAAGMNPMEKYPRTASEPEHDPLGDARLSATLLSEALKRIEVWKRHTVANVIPT